MAPALLSLILLALHFATGYRRRGVWLLWIGNDLLWCAYALTAAQLGFLVSAIPMVGIHGYNWWRWRPVVLGLDNTTGK